MLVVRAKKSVLFWAHLQHQREKDVYVRGRRGCSCLGSIKGTLSLHIIPTRNSMDMLSTIFRTVLSFHVPPSVSLFTLSASISFRSSSLSRVPPQLGGEGSSMRPGQGEGGGAGWDCSLLCGSTDNLKPRVISFKKWKYRNLELGNSDIRDIYN